MRVEKIPAWVAGSIAYLLVSDSSHGVLVDAPPDPDAIGRHIAALDVAVVAILLTHGHVDHTGGAAGLAQQTGAVTYAHPSDDFLTRSPMDQIRALFGAVPPGAYEVPERIEELQHGQMLAIGGLDIEVRHTPGHTPGHCCFYLEEQGVLLSGDQLFAGSVGRTDLPGGSWDQLVQSMRERVMTLNDDVRVLPGHGPETTVGTERATNPFRAEWGG